MKVIEKLYIVLYIEKKSRCQFNEKEKGTKIFIAINGAHNTVVHRTILQLPKILFL